VRRPAWRFTIGQLVKLIAALAVIFALIRTPIWPLAPAIGIALGGFAVGRAGGGTGILGATVAGVVGFATFGLVVFRPEDQSIGIASEDLIISLFGLALMGATFGFAVGCSAFWVCYVRDDIRRTAAQARSADAEDDRAGGRPS
jgi:hypothetical protein